MPTVFNRNILAARDGSAIHAVAEPSDLASTDTPGKHTETVFEEVTSIVTVVWPPSTGSSDKHTETVLEEVTNTVTVLWPPSPSNSGKHTETVFEEVTSIVTVVWPPSSTPAAGDNIETSVNNGNSRVPHPSDGSDATRSSHVSTTTFTRTENDSPEEPTTLPPAEDRSEETVSILTVLQDSTNKEQLPSESDLHETEFAPSASHDTATFEQPASETKPGTTVNTKPSATQQLPTSATASVGQTSVVHPPAEGTPNVSEPLVHSSDDQTPTADATREPSLASSTAETISSQTSALSEQSPDGSAQTALSFASASAAETSGTNESSLPSASLPSSGASSQVASDTPASSTPDIDQSTSQATTTITARSSELTDDDTSAELTQTTEV